MTDTLQLDNRIEESTRVRTSTQIDWHDRELPVRQHDAARRRGHSATVG
jgi:hypothetical protein